MFKVILGSFGAPAIFPKFTSLLLLLTYDFLAEILCMFALIVDTKVILNNI